MPSTRSGESKPGCTVCGAIFRKHQTVYAELANRENVPTGTKLVRSCPNNANHKKLIAIKTHLARMMRSLKIETDRHGLDLICTEQLRHKIQGARARLSNKWIKEKGFVLTAYTGELEEDL